MYFFQYVICIISITPLISIPPRMYILMKNSNRGSSKKLDKTNVIDYLYMPTITNGENK